MLLCFNKVENAKVHATLGFTMTVATNAFPVIVLADNVHLNFQVIAQHVLMAIILSGLALPVKVLVLMVIALMM